MVNATDADDTATQLTRESIVERDYFGKGKDRRSPNPLRRLPLHFRNEAYNLNRNNRGEDLMTDEVAPSYPIQPWGNMLLFVVMSHH